MLERLFRSKAEVKVLSIVLFTEGLHLREIARMAKVSPAEAKRELENMIMLGVLRVENKGNMRLYYTRRSCPFLNELKQLYIKTEGIGKTIREALSKVEGIDYSFIYGSIAKGEFGERSDIDILVIGDVNEEIVSRAVMEAQKKLGREINFVLWSRRDYKRKLGELGQFFMAVMKSKKIWVVGDENEFARAA